jgi:hypothetical protein
LIFRLLTREQATKMPEELMNRLDVVYQIPDPLLFSTFFWYVISMQSFRLPTEFILILAALNLFCHVGTFCPGRPRLGRHLGFGV